MRRLAWALALSMTLSLAPAVAAEETRALPMAAREADVDERLGGFVPRDIVLRGERGESVTTGELLAGDVPVILVLAYYRCPMLCPLLLTGVAKGLEEAGYTPGQDYRLVTVSIDPEDTETDAAKRRDALAHKLGASPGSLRFLVGTAEATRAVADAVGFRYGYDSSTDQYAHPAVVTVLAPDGRISRYLYGLEPSSRDLRLAIVEAAAGKVGTIVDRVLVTCYRYDPATRRYGPYISGFLRIGSLLILCTVGTTLGMLWRRDRRRGRGGGPR
ncbi:SCO family protein [Polyangium spumosum]|uniref:SCO family protein n=1 Tax=Polyangium spumosum TaxID=889282 RepID=A0A6N7PN04_9BACT|nr:SCO family protein [Polyangium spumosum]